MNNSFVNTTETTSISDAESTPFSNTIKVMGIVAGILVFILNILRIMYLQHKKNVGVIRVTEQPKSLTNYEQLVMAMISIVNCEDKSWSDAELKEFGKISRRAKFPLDEQIKTKIKTLIATISTMDDINHCSDDTFLKIKDLIITRMKEIRNYMVELIKTRRNIFKQESVRGLTRVMDYITRREIQPHVPVVATRIVFTQEIGQSAFRELWKPYTLKKAINSVLLIERKKIVEELSQVNNDKEPVFPKALIPLIAEYCFPSFHTLFILNCPTCKDIRDLAANDPNQDEPFRTFLPMATAIGIADYQTATDLCSAGSSVEIELVEAEPVANAAPNHSQN